MASIAQDCGLNMTGWEKMTIIAGTYHLHMIHLQYRPPGNRAMAGFANISAIDVRDRLS